MKIHEYQAKELLRDAGVAVPVSFVATTAEEASRAFEKLDGSTAIIKAQIHAGGRGKGIFAEHPEQHGVQLVQSAREAAEVTCRMIGNRLVTSQSGAEGRVVRRVLVEAACDIARELYLGIVIDRNAGLPVLMTSPAGGMDIEQIANESPEWIYREAFHPDRGLQPFQVRKLARQLGLQGPSARSADPLMRPLCKLFVDLDCSMAEINPLGVTSSGDLLALDAKITFDGNGLFRHKQLEALRDLAEEEPAEVRASKAGLSYVKLDGTIGCLVNGAGLAMSTMDLIQLQGGEPANFLDVGGSADLEAVIEAFSILLSDRNVKAVLVNIFGGIIRCTTIAEALIQAYKTIGITVPVVVRLEGTEVEQGRQMIDASDVNIIVADGLTDAAQKVVRESKR
ncbi:MAG: ADP-forming succinate--CoA ligase subunit beta [Pirellulales bacterium]|nr:ADP-forming succinate--CoA ligase subunit beta [Pirellulales bacterium]